jgi:hypothetical protein
MIRYTLECQDKHPFDGWFANSEAFDKQVERALVTCPTCGSTDVRKAIMAPNVSPRTRAKGKADSAPAARPEPAGLPAPAGPMPVTNIADPAAEKVIAFMRAVREAVEKNAENVGDRFADEARKIHYGEAEEKPIYGEATLDDAAELIEEGIMVHPLPALPEDKN